MVYLMQVLIEGTYRGGGKPWNMAACAAVFISKSGTHHPWTFRLPPSPPPSQQRAEITSVVLALELALQRYQDLHSNPDIRVAIYTASRYVIGCLTNWSAKWASNGWVNAAGKPVANLDLIQRALSLDNKLSQLGFVEYVLVPRQEVEAPGALTNRLLDESPDLSKCV